MDYELIYGGESYFPVIVDNSAVKGVLDGSLVELEDLGGATTLMPYRFNNFTSLTKLDLSSINNIVTYTCDECSNLKNLILSDNLTTVGTYAFRECRNVEVDELPKSLTSISDYAFYYFGYNKPAYKFKPTNPVSISQYAFRYSKLSEVIGEFSSLGSYAFADASINKLHATINGAIGTYAFYGNNLVNDFKLQGVPTSLGNYAFYNFGSGRSNPESNIFEFDFRNSAFTTVGEYAFQGSSTSNYNKYFDIYLPSTISSVSNYAFRYSDNFNIFFKGNSVPTVQAATFTNSTNMKIFVPYSVVNSYRVASNWSVQSNIIYGWAESETFELGDELPFANEEGYGLTWYDDLGLTNEITTVTDPSKPLYCEVGVNRIAVTLKSVSNYQATSIITDGVKNYTEGSIIAVGTNLTITLTGKPGFPTPYITTLNGNNITSPYSFIVGEDDLSLINIFWDGINIPVNPVFNQNTPAQIKIGFEQGLAPTMWALGDMTTIEIDGVGFEFRIADMTPGRYDKVGGGKTNGVLEMVKIYTTRVWNSSSNNTYASATIRPYLNTTLFELLPQEWKDIIGEVLIPTATAGSQAGGSVIQYLPEKLFMPSQIEVFNSSSESHPGEGFVFQYYDGKANSYRIKQYGSTSTIWWLRSPRAPNTTTVATVLTSGAVSNTNALYTYGVSPCFAL